MKLKNLSFNVKCQITSPRDVCLRFCQSCEWGSLIKIMKSEDYRFAAMQAWARDARIEPGFWSLLMVTAQSQSRGQFCREWAVSSPVRVETLININIYICKSEIQIFIHKFKYKSFYLFRDILMNSTNQIRLREHRWQLSDIARSSTLDSGEWWPRIRLRVLRWVCAMLTGHLSLR